MRRRLAAAVCALMGGGQAARSEGTTDVDSGVLYYGEVDRVTAIESVIQARREVAEERFLTVRFVFDALTGASANGTTPSTRPQTFTRPSGRGSYVVAAGETPLDDTFQDTRVAVNASYQVPVGRLARATMGGSFSTEHDYRSLGASAVLARDLDRRNTTLTIGLSGSLDSVMPAGGTPSPLTSMSAPSGEDGEEEDRESDDDEFEESTGSESKKVLDALIGLTQVIDRATILQVNYSVNHSTGYLTDPYKLVSVVDGVPGPDQGEPLDYLYEKRPGGRTKQSLYGQVKHDLSGDVVELSYRYMWDDWSIRSHTAEVRYRWNLGERHHVQPHLRYYRQSAASFYRHSLVSGDSVPQYASGDYRLGRFDAVTAGLKYGIMVPGAGELSLRLEYYSQFGDGSPSDAIGVQKAFNLFPTVDAVIAQIGYSIGF